MSFDGRFDGEWTGEWLGGTGEQAGFRSPLPFWHGGGIVKAGFVSPLPLFGFGAFPNAVAEEVARVPKDTRSKKVLRSRLLQEDDEILAVIMAHMIYRR